MCGVCVSVCVRARVHTHTRACTHTDTHIISKNMIVDFIQTLRLGNCLAISVTSSNFFPLGKTCLFCAKCSLLVSVSQIVFMKGFHLIYFFYLATCFPNVHDLKWVKRQS